MEKQKIIIILVVLLCGSLAAVGYFATSKSKTTASAEQVQLDLEKAQSEIARSHKEIAQLHRKIEWLYREIEQSQKHAQKGNGQKNGGGGVEKPDSGVYPVWYCTNRNPVYKNERLVDFSGERGHENHYGLCEVFVPKSHVIGSMGSPLWKQVFNVISGHKRDEPLKLESIEVLEQNMYWQKIREYFADLDLKTESDQTALVYIHGFNVSFKNATLRAAQLGVDLKVPLTAYFSWPSQGDVKGYQADEASIEVCEPYLEEFLAGFVNESGSKKIHLLVHSMGNRALLRSIQGVVAKIEGESKVAFGQIILAAPDVDRDLFMQLSGVYKDISERTTLYISSKDKALKASGFLHKYARVGFSPPVTIINGIDTVDASQIDFSLLGHGFYAEARDVLEDMHNLLVNNNPPNKRFLEEVQISEGSYWIFKE